MDFEGTKHARRLAASHAVLTTVLSDGLMPKTASLRGAGLLSASSFERGPISAQDDALTVQLLFDPHLSEAAAK